MKILIKGLALASVLAITHSASSLNAAVPSGYYDTLEGKSGVELKKAVKSLILPHTVIEYGDANPDNAFHPVDVATWTVFAESDVRDINGFPCWWDMYSANNMRVNDGHPGLNIEHSVPNSWWGHTKNEAYKDLHHLNPSDAEANGKKSNSPLGEISSASWTNGVSSIGSPKEGLGGGSSTVFEPVDVYKGDFARAYFYIFTLYDDISWLDDYAWMYDKTSSLTLKQWAYSLLLDWSKTDPVSYKELERNDVIYKYQKNRNPFIDCPELAAHIWGDRQNEPFHYALYAPSDDDPDYPGWDEEPIEMHAGQWQPVKSTDELSEDCDYFIVSPTKKRAMTYTATGSCLGECAISPLTTLVTYPEVLTAVPMEIAVVRLKKANDGWTLALSDLDGNEKGYVAVTSAKSAKLTTNPTAAGTVATITLADDRTRIVYNVNGAECPLQYNASSPRFGAYESNQAPIQLYRATDELLEDPEEDEIVDTGVGNVGLDENASEIIIGIYDLNGRKLNTTTTLDLAKGIYIVVSNHGTKKIIR